MAPGSTLDHSATPAGSAVPPENLTVENLTVLQFYLVEFLANGND